MEVLGSSISFSASCLSQPGGAPRTGLSSDVIANSSNVSSDWKAGKDPEASEFSRRRWSTALRRRHSHPSRSAMSFHCPASAIETDSTIAPQGEKLALWRMPGGFTDTQPGSLV
jgi:hypothetical protein